MDFVTNQSKAELSSAILLYKGSVGYGQTSLAYASIHDVIKEKGAARRIGPGKALSIDAIESAVKSLADSAGIDLLQWSDESVVATSPTLSCWWTPAQQRWMHFKVDDFQRSGPAQQPALVWIVSKRHLFVFAVKQDAKPTADTELFDSPYLNVYKQGNVCTGSMAANSASSREQWVKSFFESTFTHANPGDRKLTSYRGGNLALWKACMDKPEKPFPVSYLKSHKTTLGAMLKQMSK